jgi:hypothetical protein
MRFGNFLPTRVMNELPVVVLLLRNTGRGQFHSCCVWLLRTRQNVRTARICRLGYIKRATHIKLHDARLPASCPGIDSTAAQTVELATHVKTKVAYATCR